MTRRFKKVSAAIQKLVVDDDVFGLNTNKSDEDFMHLLVTMQERQAWRFLTDAKKVTAYRGWLQQQVDAQILTPIGGISDKPWTAEYVESAYRKGALRAYTDLHASELAKSPDFYEGSKAQFIREAFSAPESLRKVELLYTRSFEELKGITAAMGQQMSRTLADGLTQGRGPHAIAQELRKVSTAITKSRANVLARTEIIRAHAEGQLDSYEKLGADVGIMAEWSTAGFAVCPECGELEGVVMTVDEARGLLPRHPNCKCSWIPADRAREEEGQKRDKDKDEAIRKSIEREAPETIERSPEEVKRRSTWVGKEKVRGVAPRLPIRPRHKGPSLPAHLRPPSKRVKGVARPKSVVPTGRAAKGEYIRAPEISAKTPAKEKVDAILLGDIKAAQQEAKRICGAGVVDYGNMPPETAYEINRALARMKKQFPDFTVRSIKVADIGDDTWAQVQAYPGIGGERPYARMQLSKMDFEKYDNIKDLDAVIKSAGMRGNFSVQEGVQDLIFHESTHAMVYNHIETGSKIEGVLSKLKSLKFRGLGVYGESNGSEGLCESIVQYMRRGSLERLTGQRMGKPLVKILDDKKLPNVIKEFLGVDL